MSRLDDNNVLPEFDIAGSPSGDVPYRLPPETGDKILEIIQRTRAPSLMRNHGWMKNKGEVDANLEMALALLFDKGVIGRTAHCTVEEIVSTDLSTVFLLQIDDKNPTIPITDHRDAEALTLNERIVRANREIHNLLSTRTRLAIKTRAGKDPWFGRGGTEGRHCLELQHSPKYKNRSPIVYWYDRDREFIIFEGLMGLNGKEILERMREKEGGDLSMKLSLAIAEACAVQSIHDAKKIHGDIKPSNFMVLTDGTVMMIDMAGMIDEEVPESWQATHTITEIYAPPEQLENDFGEFPVTKSSDIFSLGCSLYEVFSRDGQGFWSAIYDVRYCKDQNADSTIHESARALLTDEEVAAVLAPLPQCVVSILQEMLSPRPSKRPNIAKIIDDLNQVASNQCSQARLGEFCHAMLDTKTLESERRLKQTILTQKGEIEVLDGGDILVRFFKQFTLVDGRPEQTSERSIKLTRKTTEAWSKNGGADKYFETAKDPLSRKLSLRRASIRSNPGETILQAFVRYVAAEIGSSQEEILALLVKNLPPTISPL